MSGRMLNGRSKFWIKARQVIQLLLTVAKKATLFFATKLVTSFALLGCIVMPFLQGVLPNTASYIIWGLCLAIFVIDSLVIWSKHKKDDEPIHPLDIFTRGYSFIIIAFSISFFVANYFDTLFTWQLALASVLVVVSPITLRNILEFFVIKNHCNARQRKNLKHSFWTFTLFCWLLIGFFVALYFGSLPWQFIAGGFGVIILFINLADVVLAARSTNKYFAVFDLLVGVALTVYLIYAIPNATVQNVVLVIVAALYGGLMTLVGVAWTIKDGQRKEQESKRLEKIPYLQASLGQWIVREKRESVLPDLWLSLTRSDNENFVSSELSIEITNIGLGLADNLECTWQSGEINRRHSLSHTLLQCNESFSMNAIVDAERKEETSYMDATLRFEFDDLLENHYAQTLSVSFQVECGCIKPTTYKMSAPVYIGRSQEVKNA